MAGVSGAGNTYPNRAAFLAGAVTVPRAKRNAQPKAKAMAASVLQRANWGDNSDILPAGDAQALGGTHKFKFPADAMTDDTGVRMPSLGLAGAPMPAAGPLPAHAGACLRNFLLDQANVRNHPDPALAFGFAAKYNRINGWRGCQFMVTYLLVLCGAISPAFYKLVDDTEFDNLDDLGQEAGYQAMGIRAQNLTQAVEEYYRMVGAYLAVFLFSTGTTPDFGTSNLTFIEKLTGHTIQRPSKDDENRWNAIFSCVHRLNFDLHAIAQYNFWSLLQSWPVTDDTFVRSSPFAATITPAVPTNRQMFTLPFFVPQGGEVNAVKERAELSFLNPLTTSSQMISAHLPSLNELAEFDVFVTGPGLGVSNAVALEALRQTMNDEPEMFRHRIALQPHPSLFFRPPTSLGEYQFGNNREFSIDNSELQTALKTFGQVIVNFATVPFFEKCRTLAGIDNKYSTTPYKTLEGLRGDKAWVERYAKSLESHHPMVAQRLKAAIASLPAAPAPPAGFTAAAGKRAARALAFQAEQDAVTAAANAGQAYPGGEHGHVFPP